MKTKLLTAILFTFSIILLAFINSSDAAIDSMKLGARYNADASKVTFRAYSSRATRIDVYLYSSPIDASEIAHFTLTKNISTNVWEKVQSLSSLKHKLDEKGTLYYGYRAWGPNWPFVNGWVKGSAKGFISDVDSNGNRFNPNKLLFDPYALEISHDPNNAISNNGTLFASGDDYRLIDSGAKAPKGIVLKSDPQSVGSKPARAQKDDIIYEVHLRGLTKNDPNIPAELQGTYKGAGLKAEYLASLGVTAVEFLPVQETQNDANNLTINSTKDSNYWGYSTLNYFSPDRRYAADKSAGGPTREFQQMAKAFHDQGIKVYIDVVYNHTGEGDNWGNNKNVINLLSWRGLDNPTYYLLTSDLQFNYDNTGAGGNFNTYNPVAQNFIIDSLAYWVNNLGVDGFRFDLASVLGNTCTIGCFNFDKMNPATALNRIARELPARAASGGAGTDLIAEPWALNDMHAYQLGNFPAGWSEWNDVFRDTFRRSQNQLGIATVTPGQMATLFAGSSSIFQSSGRQPWNSINFMVAHDGFTLKDLYSCNSTNNNQGWPFGPSDGGSNNNNSWDQAASASAQRQAARNGLALLMLSAGVPMLTGGDEHLRSLNCNNNPYNLDSNANWLNFTLSPEQQQFSTFARRLIAFRKAHPALRPLHFYQDSDTNGNHMEQLRWFTPSGSVASTSYFADANQHALAFRIDGSEFSDSASAIYIAYNAHYDMTNFVLPWPGDAKRWYRVTDTAAWNEGDSTFVAEGAETLIGGENANYGVNGRSIIVLIAK